MIPAPKRANLRISRIHTCAGASTEPLGCHWYGLVALTEACGVTTSSSILGRESRKYFTELEGDRSDLRQDFADLGGACHRIPPTSAAEPGKGPVSGEKMVRPAGLEPATLGLEGRCSIQLSYGRVSAGPVHHLLTHRTDGPGCNGPDD